jgi:uncharacterized membrane protein YpjA
MWHACAAALWLFHNEIVDYVFGMMPRYPVLAPYQDIIGYLTFWLSVLSVVLVWRMRKS